MEIKWRLWIEKEGRHIMGKGGAEILRAIREYGSISRASKMLGMSYRFIWNYLNKMEEVLGRRVVEKERGGIERGRTRLTDFGEELLRFYENFEKLFRSALNCERGVVKDVGDGKIVVEIRNPFLFSRGQRICIIPFDLEGKGFKISEQTEE